MSKYRLLDELVDTVYSVDLGLSEDQGEKMYMRMLENLDWRNMISMEIGRAFSDKNFSWAQFFFEHDIYSAESELDARTYAEKIILGPLDFNRQR